MEIIGYLALGVLAIVLLSFAAVRALAAGMSSATVRQRSYNVWTIIYAFAGLGILLSLAL